jgi:membrane protease YdiL (CAAX protease family)
LKTPDNLFRRTTTGMFNSMKVIFLDFISFLKNPVEQADPVQTRSEKAKKLFTLLLMDIPVMGVLIGVLSGMEALGLFDLDTTKFNMLFLTIPVWPLILILVILIPFFEELIFRLYLRYKYNYLLRFFVFLSSILGFQNHKKFETHVNQFWIRRYKTIFYFSAILFGFVHLANYGYTTMILIFSPLIVAPQFVAGLFLGYLRVRHGLISGFLLHAMHNAIIFCIPLLFMAGSLKNLTAETDAYTFEINGSTNLSDAGLFQYYADSVIISNSSIKSILIELFDKDELFIFKGSNEPFMNASINLKIKNKQLSDTLHRKDINYQMHRKNILNELSKSYGFKIVNEYKNQDVWELCLVDSGLLAKFVTDSIKSNRIDAFAGEISSSNTSLWQLSKALSKACNKHIVNKTGTKKKYALKLQTNDFEALQKQLSTEYGLSLKQATKEIDFTTIEF